MAGTRSSTRQAAAAAASSSPSSSQSKQANDATPSGSKCKGGPTASPKTKRGKKGDKKEQATIEDTMPQERTGDGNDVEMKDESEPKQEDDAQTTQAEAEEDIESAGKENEGTAQSGTEDNRGKEEVAPKDENGLKTTGGSKMNKLGDIEPAGDAGNDNKARDGDAAVETSSKREHSTPSSILEKGVIYFFERGRVGIDEPSSPDEIARSYIVLRPIPHGAKIGQGPIGDAGHNRLIALPKKVLPKSPKDRFMAFVEKSNIGFADLKATMSASDYATKTAGTRHSPPMAPLAEGVYAITSTGRESHLAYILTIPSEVSEVQQDIGLQQRGSFLTSVKNPTTSAPAGANLPQGPEYPQELLDEFRSLRWMPLQPKFLDYANTQFLLIGHKDNALEKATDQQNQDEGEGKDKPIEEMEKLEHEDEIRVEHLKGDNSVFTDLGLDSKEYPKVQTTW